MASPQITPLLIRLGIEGYEGIDKLSSGFRELGRVTGLTDAALGRVRASVLEYGRDSQRSEQLIRGQIDALKALRGQVSVTGTEYSRLSSDVSNLEHELRGSTRAMDAQRESIMRSVAANKNNVSVLNENVRVLERLRGAARSGSTAYAQFDRDVQTVKTSLAQAKKQAADFNTTIGQFPGASLDKLEAQIGRIRTGMRNLSIISADYYRGLERARLLETIRERGPARQEVRATAAMYASTEYERWVQSRSAQIPVPATRAGIQLQIGEINAELQNITNLERRRKLTLELDRLNRQLKTTVSDVVSQEQRAVDAVRARLNAQRQLLSQSGFAAFSREASSGMLPYEAARQSYESDKRLQTEAVADYIAALDTRIAAANAHYQTVQENAARAAAAEIDIEQDRTRLATQIRQREAAEEDKRFRAELDRLDILKQQRLAAKEAMQLRGPLSPFYRSVIGMAGADVERQQMFMGRNATTVFNDIATSFAQGGRPVDMRERSRPIGESITQGINAGATSEAADHSAAKSLAATLLNAYKRAFRIKSPSGESRDQIGVPLGQGIGEGIIQGLRGMRSQVRAAIQDVMATPGRAPLPGSLGFGPSSDVADRLQTFLARTSARTSTYLPLARLMGEGVLQSQALPLAAYRRSYERGGIVPSTYLPVEARRGLRGTAGIPGAGIEEIIRAEAMREVARTGAFVGPLSGPVFRAAPQSAPLSLPGTLGGAYPARSSAASPLFTPGRVFRDFMYADAPGRRVPYTFAPPLDPTAPTAASLRGAIEATLAQSVRDAASGRGSVRGFPLSGMLARPVPTPGIGPSLNPMEVFSTLSGVLRSPQPINTAAAIPTASNLPRLRAALLGPLAALNLRAGTAFSSYNTNAPSASATSTGFTAPPRGPIPAVFSGLHNEILSALVPPLRLRMRGTGSSGRYRPDSGAGDGGVPPTTAVGPGAPGPANNLRSVNTELAKFGDLSKRSTADLRSLSGVLVDFRDNLSPLDGEYKKVNAAIERQGEIIDRELERRQRRRRRLSGMQLAQTAGAAISGGIFGGVEGFLGGAIGGAIGGVGGAFAGAAIGAQVGMVRQQIGELTASAAQVERLKISLRGVAGSTAEYERALAAATIATQRFNITPTEAIQGLTRLTAAVRGAGGSVRDAEMAYNAVTAAIRATGGSTADAEAAVLAMSQIFSKGRVTAEELSGQIGERLPGAVTLFAQATGRTLPELQKDLEKGVVGLNDLMKFVVATGERYSPLMDKLAGSTESAGDRMRVSLANLGKAFGDAFKPAGAQVQNMIGQLADLALQAARSLNLVRQAAGAEITVERGKDLGRRVGEASRYAEQSGMSLRLPFTADPRRLAYESVQRALTAVTPQQNAEGARQNLQALRNLREVQRRIGIGDVPSDRAETRQRLLEAQGASIDRRIAEETALIEKLKQAEKANLTVFGAPKGDGQPGKEAEKQQDKAAKDAADRAREQAFLEIDLLKANFEQRISLDNKAHEHAMELARKRSEYTEDLIRRETQLWVTSTVGEQRQARTVLSGFISGLRGTDTSVTEFEDKVKAAQQRLKALQAQEKYAATAATQRYAAEKQHAMSIATIAQPSIAGVYRQGSIGPTSTGPHFDIKRSDLSYFDRRALDPYVTVNGKPLSTGYTDPGGTFDAYRRRASGPQQHRGWDYAFAPGAGLQLTGGAKWLETQRGTAHGDATAFMTPDGKVYRILHGKFEAAGAAGVVQAGVPSMPPVDTSGPNLVEARTAVLEAAADVKAAQEELRLATAQRGAVREAMTRQFIQDATESVREQTDELARNKAEIQLRNRLQLEGVRPEIIDAEVRKADTLRRVSVFVGEVRSELQGLIDNQKGATKEADAYRRTIAELEAAMPTLAASIDETAKAAVDFNNAMAFRQDMRIGEGFNEGVRSYVESIGTMREAITKLSVDGFSRLTDAITTLTTTGKVSFADFANSIIADTTRIITQQLIMRSLFSLFNFGGAGAAGSAPLAGFGAGPVGYDFGGVPAFAQGGVSSGPTSGYPATLHGTEAVVPLSGSRAIPVDLRGSAGGQTIINVNVETGAVDAQGPDAAAGQDLARDLAQVVDARLVYHRRPGGLLSPTR